MAKKAKMNCPKCGSDHLIGAGFKFASGKKVRKFECRNCGRFTNYPVVSGKPVAVMYNTGVRVPKERFKGGK